MKKFCFCFSVFLFIACILPFASAEEGYSDEFRHSVSIENSLLSENADLNDPSSVMKDLQFKKIVSYLFLQFKNSFTEAIGCALQGITLVLLSVIINRCIVNVQSQNLKMIFSCIVSLSVALTCRQVLNHCGESLQKSIEDMHVFTAACIPSFSVVMIAAGESGGATVFSMCMVLLGEIGTLISRNLLLPLVHVYLAVGIVSSVGDDYNFGSIAKNIRKFVIWMVGLLVVVFRWIMKLQFGAAASADRIGQKYIRAAVGGLVPMVGSSISDGVDGLFAVASGVKVSFAIAGVLIVLSVILPILIKVGVYGLIWSGCRWFAEFMNDAPMRSVADVLANCFFMMLALGGCVGLMGLFSFFGIMTVF